MMDLPPGHRRANRRRGVTLLELLVVVTLMGTLSTVVVTRYGRDIFGDLGARSEAHRLSLDLQRAKSVTTPVTDSSKARLGSRSSSMGRTDSEPTLTSPQHPQPSNSASKDTPARPVS